MPPSIPFLTIDGTPISLAEALRYLQASGHLASFLGEILRQHVLEREIQSRRPVVRPALVDLALADFQATHRLDDDGQLAEWLTLRGQDLAAFRATVERDFQIEMIKQEVTNPLLPGYFLDRRPFLDQVLLSCLIASDREEASGWRRRAGAGEPFDSLAGESAAGIRPERFFRMDLPAALRGALEGAPPGRMEGPVELRGTWALVRLDQDLPASLEDPEVSRGLREELFECWLAERLERLSVELQAS